MKLIVDFGIVDLLYYGFELFMLNFWRLLFVKCWNGDFFVHGFLFYFNMKIWFFFLKYHTNKTFENIFQGIFKYVIKSLEKKKNLFPQKYFFSKKFYFEINFNLNNKLWCLNKSVLLSLSLSFFFFFFLLLNNKSVLLISH